MKISIVTISYNQGQFLEQAIRSIIDQNFNDVEYIIVDAGSTDGSREIIDRFSDKLTRIILEPDAGPADGLNKGFHLATGEVFGFLNSDDMLEPNALSRVAAHFKENPRVDVISGHSLIVNAEGRVKRKFYSDKYSLLMAAYGASFLSQPSTFFRGSAYRKVGGFNKNNRSNWDGELWADMALSGAKFQLIDAFLSRFRVYEGSITSSGASYDPLRKLYHQRLFRKIMGREPYAHDHLIKFFAQYSRKILNIRDTFERLQHGPISNASQ